jgi:acetylglutamate kinase|tara:strand:- start:215 stop:1075 length:861 start_codon:yes stop_codon:yes gene_type:complete
MPLRATKQFFFIKKILAALLLINKKIRKMEKLSIVKIGGNIIKDESSLYAFLKLFSDLKGKKILVHGGGKRATQLASQLGIVSKIVAGRRITDASTLEIITMVYGGLVNKNIVAKLQALQIDAIGLTGADANSIHAEKRPVTKIDYGFVGDVKEVNSNAIDTLITAEFTPVFCAITHDGNGQLLNTNADTVASQIAIGMSKRYDTALYYCFELDGVLRDFNDKASVVQQLDTKTYQKLRTDGIIADGMLPKLENCFDALKSGVSQVYIGNTGMLSKENDNFTTITL